MTVSRAVAGLAQAQAQAHRTRARPRALAAQLLRRQSERALALLLLDAQSLERALGVRGAQLRLRDAPQRLLLLARGRLGGGALGRRRDLLGDAPPLDPELLLLLLERGAQRGGGGGGSGIAGVFAAPPSLVLLARLRLGGGVGSDAGPAERLGALSFHAPELGFHALHLQLERSRLVRLAAALEPTDELRGELGVRPVGRFFVRFWELVRQSRPFDRRSRGFDRGRFRRDGRRNHVLLARRGRRRDGPLQNAPSHRLSLAQTFPRQSALEARRLRVLLDVFRLLVQELVFLLKHLLLPLRAGQVVGELSLLREQTLDLHREHVLHVVVPRRV